MNQQTKGKGILLNAKKWVMTLATLFQKPFWAEIKKRRRRRDSELLFTIQAKEAKMIKESFRLKASKVFTERESRKNLEKWFDVVYDELDKALLGNDKLIAFAFATIRVETAQFKPISEYISKYNTVKEPFDKYEFRKNLGNTEIGDGAKFKGRGFIQLTGRYNYEKYGHIIGADIITNPERANDPDLASQILARFIIENKAKILGSLLKNDFYTARKAVNGGTHGLKEFTESYKKMIE